MNYALRITQPILYRCTAPTYTQCEGFEPHKKWGMTLCKHVKEGSCENKSLWKEIDKGIL